jgi:hypothetical protein
MNCDLNGNRLSDGMNTYVWDSCNHLAWPTETARPSITTR